MSNGVVVIVDDDMPMRDSLEFRLGTSGFEVHGFASAEALLTSGQAAAADCLLLDVRLGSGMDGISLLEKLRRDGVRTPVVVMTGHGDIPLVVRAMQHGAQNFLEKPFAPGELLIAVAGAIEHSDSVGDLTLKRSRAQMLTNGLAPRERQVLAALIAGRSNKEMARQLGLSPRTVEGYRARMMEKLGVESFADAVRIGLVAGLTQGPVDPQQD